jgi:hypothetical protein
MAFIVSGKGATVSIGAKFNFSENRDLAAFPFSGVVVQVVGKSTYRANDEYMRTSHSGKGPYIIQGVDV